MTSPDYYTPRSWTALDYIAAAKRTADQAVRNNPLVSATITEGLMRWLGNYLDDNGDPVSFLWVGEFFPADPVMGKPQNGVVMFRDDITQGVYAFALYDHAPNLSGSGLRQTIHLQSGDEKRLYDESRDWGLKWPRETTPLGAFDQDTSRWPGTPNPYLNGDWYTLHEGRMNVLGNNAHWRHFVATSGGAAGEFRVRIDAEHGQPEMTSTTTVLGVNTNTFVSGSMSMVAHRGNTVTVRLEGRVTNGVGRAHIANIVMQCYSPG